LRRTSAGIPDAHATDITPTWPSGGRETVVVATAVGRMAAQERRRQGLWSSQIAPAAIRDLGFNRSFG